MADVEWHEDGADDLFHSADWRRHLDRLGFTIVGHAIPHSGVDTGALVGSMTHRVDETPDGLELVLGSGAADGVPEIWYAAPHWADRPPTTPAPTTVGRRPRIPHPTKPKPTKPWTKALAALGIAYTVEPGGYES